MLSFAEARQLVITQAKTHAGSRPTISLPISDALGHVLAQEIRSDREYPPFNRSTRDGYAVRASSATQGASLRCAGEIKAGDTVSQPLAPGTCVQIMTGAAIPPGADAVVMIEFTRRSNDSVSFDRPTQSGQNIVPCGSEAHAGDLALEPGLRLGFAELAVAAQSAPPLFIATNSHASLSSPPATKSFPSLRRPDPSTSATAIPSLSPHKSSLPEENPFRL